MTYMRSASKAQGTSSLRTCTFHVFLALTYILLILRFESLSSFLFCCCFSSVVVVVVVVVVSE